MVRQFSGLPRRKQLYLGYKIFTKNDLYYMDTVKTPSKTTRAVLFITHDVFYSHRVGPVPADWRQADSFRRLVT